MAIYIANDHGYVQGSMMIEIARNYSRNSNDVYILQCPLQLIKPCFAIQTHVTMHDTKKKKKKIKRH